jgi:hypothetical protein
VHTQYSVQHNLILLQIHRGYMFRRSWPHLQAVYCLWTNRRPADGVVNAKTCSLCECVIKLICVGPRIVYALLCSCIPSTTGWIILKNSYRRFGGGSCLHRSFRIRQKLHLFLGANLPVDPTSCCKWVEGQISQGIRFVLSWGLNVTLKTKRVVHIACIQAYFRDMRNQTILQ